MKIQHLLNQLQQLNLIGYGFHLETERARLINLPDKVILVLLRLDSVCYIKDMMIKRTYSVDEIFQDIEDEEDLCLMVIPQEVLDVTGWVPGDTLSIAVENNSIVIKKA